MKQDKICEGRMERRMNWYHKLLIVLGVIGLIFLFIVFGLRIDTVKVEGTKIYTEKEITDSVFTRKFSDNELFFAIYNKIFGINKLPFVEDIEVTYEDRNTVVLHVYDKTISGCIRYMGQYVYFDKDGIVLQSMTEKKEGVPVVTGISFGTFTVGEAFHVEDDSMFSTIMNLSQLITHYSVEVDRLHMEKDKVMLYAGEITVTLDRKEMYDDEISVLSSVLGDYKDKKFSGTINMENFERGDKVILRQTPIQREKKQKK